MVRLRTGELKVFENILIQDGNILDLNYGKFKQIVLSTTGIDVTDENYSTNVAKEMGTSSKGKTLIYFCHHESEENVLKVLSELIDYAENMDYESYDVNQEQLEKAKNILDKYQNLDYLIVGNTTEEKIDNLIKDINQSIRNEKPEFTLDRLHTLMKNYFKGLCETHGIEYSDNDPLDHLVSRYTKFISKKLDSDLSKTILKQAGSNFKKYNMVRNKKSYAHDNDILNSAESLLIYRNIVAIYEFIKTIEKDVL